VAETFQRERRDVLFCRTRWVDAELRSLGELAPTPRWLTATAHACLGWCYMSASSTFMTPKLYREQRGFDRSFLKSSDYEFYTRVLCQQIPFSRVQTTVSMYRRHDDNESGRQDDDFWRDYHMVRQRFAPKSMLMQKLCSLLLKTWIYARNPAWAYHQLIRKLRSGHLRG
jgi:GT2 family glycosyltransferase